MFGDASHTHLLEAVNLRKSRAVVIAISGQDETQEIVRAIRSVCQTTYLVVRSKYVRETDELLALGADDVIPQEFETSIEIAARIMSRFLIPMESIDGFISLLRSDNYQLLEGRKKLPRTFTSRQLPNLNITTLMVGRDSGGPVGKSIGEANIRNEHGVNIIGIRRNDKMYFNFNASEKILQNDLLFVYGEPERVHRFQERIA